LIKFRVFLTCSLWSRYFNSAEGCRYGPYCSYTHRRFPSFVIAIENSSDDEDADIIQEEDSHNHNHNSKQHTAEDTTSAENRIRKKRRRKEFEGEGEALAEDEGILKKVDELAKQWQASVKKPADIYWA
jgi:hypothetical protein